MTDVGTETLDSVQSGPLNSSSVIYSWKQIRGTTSFRKIIKLFWHAL
jgi:hypothetical protein